MNPSGLSSLSSLCLVVQLEQEKALRNASIWAQKEYYANFTLYNNDSEATAPPMDPGDVIRGPCWETAVGIVTRKLTFDLIMFTFYLNCCIASTYLSH